MNRPWKARIVMAHGHPTQEPDHRRGKTKSLPLTLATSTAAGALMLLRPADWPAPLRWTYLTAPGVLVSTGSALLLLGKAHDESPRGTDTAGRNAERSFQRLRTAPLPARLGLSLGLGVMITGSQALSLWVDAGAERWLRRRGLAHPRRWMAAATALIMLAADLGENSDSPGTYDSGRKD